VRDLKKYWKDVREMERNLPPFVWLMSLEDSWRGLTGGVLTEVPAAEAAKLLYAKSHRPATAEEIAAHMEKRSAAVRQEFHADLRRKASRSFRYRRTLCRKVARRKMPRNLARGGSVARYDYTTR